MFYSLPRWFRSYRCALVSLVRVAVVLALTAAACSAGGQALSTAPTTNVGTISGAQTATITLSVSGKISSINVLTQGASNSDFQVVSGAGSCFTDRNLGTTVFAGISCTVQYTFTPSHPWTRYGGITLLDSSNNVLGYVYLTGTGTGPQLNFITNPYSLFSLAGTTVPTGIALDGAGNIYLAEPSSNQVLRVPATDRGCLTAGDCTAVGSGLSMPNGVAVDGIGNLYIADTGNNRVLKVPPTDLTCSRSSDCMPVGTGLVAPKGVAVDANGYVYISTSNSVLRETLVAGVWTGFIVVPSTANITPAGVAVDSAGDVYVADPANGRVLEESPATTGAGYNQTNVISGLNQPQGVGVDGANNIYVADTDNNQLLVYLPSTSSISLQLTGLDNPWAVAVDGGGNIYLAENSGSNSGAFELDGADPPSFSFAATAVGSTSSDSPQSVTVGNGGNAPLNFSVPSIGTNPMLSSDFILSTSSGGTQLCPQLTPSSSAVMLQAGESCDFAINFTPIAQGQPTGSMVATDNNLNVAGATQTFALSGTVISAPVIAVSAPVAVTGGLALRAAISYTGPFAPTGAVTFAIGSTTVPGSCVFSSASPGQCTVTFPTTGLTIGNNYTITVNEAADLNYGVSVGTLIFTYGSAFSLSAPDLGFSSQAIGTTSGAVTVTVTNTGLTPLTVSGISITGDFSETNTCLPAPPGGLQPSASCSIMVTFTPTVSGMRTGLVTLAGNGTNPTIYLSGYGVGNLQTLVNLTPYLGFTPSANLIQASDGNFYGTTSNGGGPGGTILQITPAGVATVLFYFTGNNPVTGTNLAGVTGGLIQGTDGNFYGTTYWGGNTDHGSAFQLTPGGVYTQLHSFPANSTDGQAPTAPLVQGTDGNFYGTTQLGGANSGGTIFKMTPEGSVTLIHSFGSSAMDGQVPLGGLLQASDGNFYGTTSNGGAYSSGTIFRITPSGTYSVIHSFAGPSAEGSNPEGPLVEGPDSNLYGTTNSGGARNVGTFFNISLGGTLTTVSSFPFGTAYSPQTGAILGSDGNFYATTTLPSSGLIVELNSSGSITPLASFDGADGSAPEGMVQGMDGNFYGMTNGGGLGDGVVFVHAASPALPGPVQLSISPSNPTLGQSFTMTYKVANAYSATMQYCFATNNAGDTTGWTGLKTGSPTAATQTLTATAVGTFNYTMTCGGVESDVLAVTVGPAVPVFGTMMFSPATEPAGTSQTVTISDTVTYSGPQPTGAVKFVLNGVSYSAACTAAGGLENCLASVPAATIAALATGSYTVTGALAGDSNYTVATAGVGTFVITGGPPVVSLSTATLSFSNQAVGVSSGPLSIVVTNVGHSALIVSNLSTTGDFSQTNNCIATQTAAAGSCTIMVTFTPAANGARSGTLTLTDNATTSGSQQQVALSGYGGGQTGAQVQTLLSLNYSTTGDEPVDMNLIQGSDGNFYGTTSGGGSGGAGTVFKVSPAGVPTVLHNFTNSLSDGGAPQGGLVEGTDGNYYGTTFSGGRNNEGVVYKVTSGGSFTLLYSFGASAADGQNPIGALVQGTDGNFYGVTSLGGASGLGTVFEITSAGVPTILHSFAGGNSEGGNLDGESPAGGLVQGADGNLYGMALGTTERVITDTVIELVERGLRFKLSLSGVNYQITGFIGNGNTDTLNNSSLVQNSDGNFYSVSYNDGASNQGMFFEITPSGTITTLSSFASPTDYPNGGLTLGSDGNFYLTLSGNGSGTSSASVAQLTSSGTLTLLSSLATSSPLGMIQGMDGNFYGTTSTGGSFSQGSVFELPASPSLPGPVQLSISPTTLTLGQSFTMTYKVANAYSATMQYCFATNNAGDTSGWTGLKTGSPTAATQTLTATAAGTFNYTLTCGGVESAVIAVTVAAPVATFGTMTFSPAATVAAGTNENITISDTLTYSGPLIPTGAVSFILNGVAYRAVCSTVGSPETCTVTVPAATIAALPSRSYTVTGGMAADSNYTAATATSGTFTITNAPPSVSLSAYSLSFGNQLVGTSSPTSSVVVSNTGAGALTISNVSIAGDFSQTNNCTAAPVAVGATCTIVVTFTPSAAGARSGLLTLTDNAPSSGSQQQVPLTGIGGFPTGAGLATILNLNVTYGALPTGVNLIQGSDGSFYGTAIQGGGGAGSAFKVTAAGVATLLHGFTGTASDGASPYSGLVEGTDGTFYGTTLGKSTTLGTLYKVTSGGSFTLLHTFAGSPTDGTLPVGTLVQGTDGNIYGTTYTGGAYNLGTLYQITPSGTFTLLHSFGGPSDGQNPGGGLVQGSDGNLYGMTTGGLSSNGTIYKVSLTGAGYSQLHTFPASIYQPGGYYGTATLVQYSDGNLYGTTNQGGASNQGTFFKISPSGTFTLVSSFSSPTDYPLNGVTLGSDGNFYATLNGAQGGSFDSIVELNSSGALTLLAEFPSASGEYQWGLIQGMDGNLYGMSYDAGSGPDGTVYELPFSPAMAGPVQLSISPSAPIVGQSFTMTYKVANAYSDTMQYCFATNNAGDTTGWTGLKTGSVTAATQSLIANAAGTFHYSLTCGGVESDVLAVTVAPAAAVFGTMTFSPAAAEPYGTHQAITISDTLTYAGAQPTGLVTFVLNGVSYAATCSNAGSPETCSATVPAATIGALPATSYTVTGVLAADSNYAVALAATGTFTITKAAVSFGVMTFSPAATEPYGTSQLITISDTLTYSGSQPTGVVSYSLNGVAYATTCTMTGSPETCSATVPPATIAALPAAAYSVTGSFAGDSNYSAATASSGTFTITRGTASLGVMTFSPAASESYGTSQTILISDTLTFSGPQPAGAVTYVLNGVSYPSTCTTTASPETCTATVSAATVAALPVNVYGVTGNFAGDTNYAAASTANGIFTVALASTGTALGVSPASLTVGQTLTLTANVSATTGVIPAGTVTFFNGATALGTATLSGTGIATLSLRPPVGTYSITASYAGSSTDHGSLSTSMPVTVGTAGTATGVAASGMTLVAGQNLTLTATVTGSGSALPTGSVVFHNGAIILGSGALSSGGVATFSFSPSVGSYNVTASYGGDSSNNSSTSSPVTVSVVLIGTTNLALGVSNTTITYGQTLTLTSTATGSIPGHTPSGSVSFNIGQASLVAAPLSVAGVATYSFAPAAGTYSISASYGGDTFNGVAASTPVSVIVNPAVTALSLSSSLNPAPQGSAITFSIVVQSTAGVPSGAVTLMDGATVLSVLSLNAGTTTYSTSSLASGTHNLTAIYAAAGNFAGSQAALNEVVFAPPTFSISASGPLRLETQHHGPVMISVTPINGFSGNVVLSCGALPQWVTCEWGSASSTSATVNASGGAASTQLTIDTSAVLGYEASGQTPLDHSSLGSDAWRFAFAGLLFPVAWFFTRKQRTRVRLLVYLLAVFSGLGLSGCSGKLPDSTSPGTYNITISGTSGSVQNSGILTLVITK